MVYFALDFQILFQEVYQSYIMMYTPFLIKAWQIAFCFIVWSGCNFRWLTKAGPFAVRWRSSFTWLTFVRQDTKRVTKQDKCMHRLAAAFSFTLLLILKYASRACSLTLLLLLLLLLLHPPSIAFCKCCCCCCWCSFFCSLYAWCVCGTACVCSVCLCPANICKKRHTLQNCTMKPPLPLQPPLPNARRSSYCCRSSLLLNKKH